MFGSKGGIKPGQYAFAVQKDGKHNKIIIGRIRSVSGGKVHVAGTYVRPLGLIDRVESGRASGRPIEVLSNPDPNNCIFMLIDRKSTRLNSSHANISYAVFCLKKKKEKMCELRSQDYTI